MAACLLAVLAVRADPVCRACHPNEVARHERTNHARTLRPAAETEFGRALPEGPLGEARGGFLLSYSRDGKGLAVRAERGKESADGRIDWVLGAGDQGVTPLVTFAGRWLEHRISYYTKPGRFDLTLGHAPGASRSAAAALGVAQPEKTIRTCLGCHGKVAPESVGIVAAGVTCDRCHAGATEHARSRTPVKTPAQLTARAQVELCSECHRMDAPGAANDPLNIRFQSLRLVKSKCFAVGGAACGNCHAAHENAVRESADFYRAKCQGCHESVHARENRDCLPCHMPKSSPAPYLQFTDHYIRVAVKGR